MSPHGTFFRRISSIPGRASIPFTNTVAPVTFLARPSTVVEASMWICDDDACMYASRAES